MFDCNRKSSGTGYTRMVTLLAIAFIFFPGFLLLARPLGYATLLLAISCSGLCVALASVTWKKSSQRSIPSIVIQDEDAK